MVFPLLNYPIFIYFREGLKPGMDIQPHMTAALAVMDTLATDEAVSPSLRQVSYFSWIIKLDLIFFVKVHIFPLLGFSLLK